MNIEDYENSIKWEKFKEESRNELKKHCRLDSEIAATVAFLLIIISITICLKSLN